MSRERRHVPMTSPTWMHRNTSIGVFEAEKAEGGSFRGVRRKPLAQRILTLLASLTKRTPRNR